MGNTVLTARPGGKLLQPRFILLAIMTVIAGWLRFSATSFGMPGLARPDEQVLIYPALHFRGDWNPHWAGYPAGQMYLLSAALRAYATIEGSTFDRFYEGNEGANYLVAHVVSRRVTAALGTATVPAIYFAASPIFGVPAALTAAAFVTIAPIHVLDSKFATTDVAAGFWITLAAAMILRIANTGNLRYYVLAGLFCGLATATKYQAVPIVFGVAAAHLEDYWRTARSWFSLLGDHRIYLAALVTLLTFVCATPYVFLDWQQTRNDYAMEMRVVLHGGFPGEGNSGYGFDWLLWHAMPACFGPSLEIAMVAAILWALLGYRRGAFSLAIFLGVIFLILLRSRLLYYRYLLIPFPALALLSGALLADLAAYVSVRTRSGVGGALLATAITLVVVPLLINDVQLDRLLARVDTRILARQWIFSHVPQGQRIAVIENGTPYGKPPLSERNITFPFQSCGILRADKVSWVLSDNYPPIGSPGPSPEQSADLDAHASVVYDYDPLVAGDKAPIFDPSDAFYAPLQNTSGVKRPGPRIRIWKLNDATH